MKIARRAGLAALLAAGALVLAACGSDNNASTTTSAAAAGTGGSAAASGSAGGSAAAGSATSFEGAGFTCATGSLRSSGSTAQGKVMEQWIADYNAKCGATINAYGGGGSGKGISDFIANQVDFAGSDSALKEDQAAQAQSQRCAGNPALNLPMVTGPIALAYNVSGVDSLTLTPEVIAGIFAGTITTWNDPAIAAINPGVTLPATGIQAVHRAEDSGTTENFTKYLKAAAPSAWTFDPAKAWAAPGGVAAQGSDGVSKQVKSTDGSIGYVEWGFALDDGLNVAEVDNGGGAVELSAESAGKAVEAATVVGTGKDLALKLDYATKEPGAYPLILVTYEITCSAGNAADIAPLLKSFLGYTATDGQATLSELGAAPLPASIQEKVIASVSTIS
ncbi:phosphate ABC transporter substrate-binding protein PstS [Nakamurella sp.]|uniref:phosphate ABC transporter substrate-binding protein PstS n=1 Tax=Nakamurella sp. TaxID=1869182 RepID=UPI003B3B0D8D